MLVIRRRTAVVVAVLRCLARLAGGAPNERMPHADSLIVLMGFKVLADVRGHHAGWDPETPAVLIERGTAIWERRRCAVVVSAREAQALGCESPVILALRSGGALLSLAAATGGIVHWRTSGRGGSW